MSRSLGWRRWAHLIVVRRTTLVRVVTSGAVHMLGSRRRKTRTSPHSALLTRFLLDSNPPVAYVPVVVDEIASISWRMTVRPSIAFPLHIVSVASRSRRRTRGRDSSTVRASTCGRTRRTGSVQAIVARGGLWIRVIVATCGGRRWMRDL
jgi:hypothetical protein